MTTAVLSQKGKTKPVSWEGCGLAAFLMAAGVAPDGKQLVAVEGEVIAPQDFATSNVPEGATVTAIERIVGG